MPECENNMASGVLGLASRMIALKQCDTLFFFLLLILDFWRCFFSIGHGQIKVFGCLSRTLWIDGLTVNGKSDSKRRFRKYISSMAGQNDMISVFKARKK